MSKIPWNISQKENPFILDFGDALFQHHWAVSSKVGGESLATSLRCSAKHPVSGSTKKYPRSEFFWTRKKMTPWVLFSTQVTSENHFLKVQKLTWWSRNFVVGWILMFNLIQNVLTLMEKLQAPSV